MKKILISVFVILTFAFVTTGCNAENNISSIVEGQDKIAYASDSDSGQVLLGSFFTDFSTWAKARNHNIRLASEKINGVVVEPGEMFSFNDTLGPTGRAQGYKEAKIFIKGKEEKGYGGGVCQVSSTLFNACDFAGLEINERHNHSKKVTYVPKGRDAATSYNGIDFKFTNTKPFPVRISSAFEEGKITVSIYSA